VENRKFFSEEFLSTIERVQLELKQVEVDASFTVVDNKKEEHRYKYQKKVIYIEKEQIEEAAKVAQYL
jgi:predicted RND superfamily exporter protein